MARPRKPTAVLELKGAYDKNPQRRAAREGEPQVEAPLGDPPHHLHPEEWKCWVEIASGCHSGVLSFADRQIVEAAAKLLAASRYVHPRFIESGELPPVDLKVIARLEMCLDRLGMTPSARSKVRVLNAPPAPADPLDEFGAPQTSQAH